MPADGRDSDDDATATDDAATDDAAAATDDAGEYVGEYDKLVRDDVPAVVRADGNRPVTRRVDGREYESYLAAKLREEVEEVLDAIASRDAASVDRDDDGECGGSTRERAESADELLSELADAYAVLDAIAVGRGYSMATVRERAREKADARGGFADGVVLERIHPRTSSDGGRTDEE